eukprot:Hpha_TRINITY_DN17137_c0_g1::TRINITY_DN17137_c0_g1_i1::g.146857::m.146857
MSKKKRTVLAQPQPPGSCVPPTFSITPLRGPGQKPVGGALRSPQLLEANKCGPRAPRPMSEVGTLPLYRPKAPADERWLNGRIPQLPGPAPPPQQQKEQRRPRTQGSSRSKFAPSAPKEQARPGSFRQRRAEEQRFAADGKDLFANLLAGDLLNAPASKPVLQDRPLTERRVKVVDVGSRPRWKAEIQKPPKKRKEVVEQPAEEEEDEVNLLNQLQAARDQNDKAAEDELIHKFLNTMGLAESKSFGLATLLKRHEKLLRETQERISRPPREPLSQSERRRRLLASCPRNFPNYTSTASRDFRVNEERIRSAYPNSQMFAALDVGRGMTRRRPEFRGVVVIGDDPEGARGRAKRGSVCSNDDDDPFAQREDETPEQTPLEEPVAKSPKVDKSPMLRCPACGELTFPHRENCIVCQEPVTERTPEAPPAAQEPLLEDSVAQRPY